VNADLRRECPGLARRNRSRLNEIPTRVVEGRFRILAARCSRSSVQSDRPPMGVRPSVRLLARLQRKRGGNLEAEDSRLG
jgi:hypothetical protein